MSTGHPTAGEGEPEFRPRTGITEDPAILNELHQQLGEALGKGSYGAVYSLKNANGKAVKEIPLDGLLPNTIDKLKDDLSLFCRIAHPGVIRYNQIVSSPHTLYIVMDRYYGSLDLLIRVLRHKKQVLDRTTMFEVIKQITDALAYLHSPNKVDSNGDPIPVIVHGDLKPANILVNEAKSRFVITDFDTTINRGDPQLTRVGTLNYMAPEVLLENKHSSASDMWSFGVILYEAFTSGKFPFPGDCRLEEFYKKDFTLDLSAIDDRAIQYIISCLLVKRPERRLSAENLSRLLATSGSLDPLETILKMFTLEMECKSNQNEIVTFENERCAYMAKIENLENEITTLRQELESTKSDIAKIMFESIHDRANRAKHEQEIMEEEVFRKYLEALRKEDLKSIRKLMARYPDSNPRDPQGKTLLMHAVETNNEEIIKLLMHQEKRLTDKNGRTALMYAIIGGHLAAVKTLSELEAGMQDCQGRTALMYAALNDSIEVIATLLEPEAGCQDLDGRTALMYATKRGNKAAISALAPKEKNLKDLYQERAIDQAIKANSIEAVNALMLHEDPPANFATNDAIKKALAEGNLEAINLMISCQKNKD